ncbi:MAG TPA: long-chain-fatty-acid--CoA ligase [Deferrisomatales bacterium]|nr:long-chain-fatty-acid--CoA ligase [Deferrisomatales bacterium]
MNLGTLLTKSARTYGDHVALVHGAKRRTYREFNARANRLANALCRLGVRKGDHVAILQYNELETLEALFACFKAGCAAVPINFRLHPREFAFIIDHSECKAVVFSREFNDPIREVRASLPKVRQFVALEGARGELLDYEAVLSAESDHWVDADVQPDDVAWLFYTSGTTGSPKGAMLTHRNLLAMTMNFFADMAPLGPGDAILHAAPLSHGSGLYAIPNMAKAATNVILPTRTFDPEVVCRAIEEHRITNMFVAPTMLKVLVESPWVDRYDLSSMRCLNYGGGPMYVEDLKKAIDKLGPCLVQLFGQGEAPMTITYLPTRDHVSRGTPEQLGRLASAGISRTDVEVKIVDDGGNELPSGCVGEIVTRSDLVMAGYWNNPEATDAALRGGWLHTGDVGYLDAQGYLFILDRSKDMIITGGENVYPRELEEVLLRHPAVREVAVIGVPDATWGETITAHVVCSQGAAVSEEALIAFCKNHLASYKKPKKVVFVSQLPKNNYGKILKRELRNRYWKGHDRQL